ncbi:hypothetical protein F4604DRAFT_1689989 [Suillus subluteus]|nr:hypothetical protein F4604DRAFT_1689989 [Suillus subluteus]
MLKHPGTKTPGLHHPRDLKRCVLRTVLDVDLTMQSITSSSIIPSEVLIGILPKRNGNGKTKTGELRCAPPHTLAVVIESWDAKGKFPPSIKPILADVALKAVNLGEYDEDFFNLMPVLFPYNHFTMNKPIKRIIFTDHLNILTDREDELLQQHAGLMKEGFSQTTPQGKGQERKRSRSTSALMPSASTDERRCAKEALLLDKENLSFSAKFGQRYVCDVGRQSTGEPHQLSKMQICGTSSRTATASRSADAGIRGVVCSFLPFLLLLFFGVGQRSKKCVLTISRLNGSVYSRKSDTAATLAIEMGALDFITYRDPEELKRGLALVSFDSSQNQECTRARIG